MHVFSHSAHCSGPDCSKRTPEPAAAELRRSGPIIHVLFPKLEAVLDGPALTMMTTMMVSLISPARVVPHLYARDVWHVIEELTRLAAAETLLDHDAIREAVLERGEVSSFGFGRGVAIPHAAIPGLRQPVGVLARLKPAQDFGAADEIPADLVFLLLSPDGDDPTHLRTLACVVRRLRDREVAARLRSAKGAEAINVVLTSDAWRGTDARDRYSGETSAATSGRDLTNVEMCTSIKPLC